jgi:hypothetical protein
VLPPEAFDHAAHLRAAHLYARAYAFPGALLPMRAAVQAYTAALGRRERYHETITTAFMAVLAQVLSSDLARQIFVLPVNGRGCV